MSKRYYTIKEIAYLFGVSEELVHKWIGSGSLKYERIMNLTADRNYYNGTNVRNQDVWCWGITEEALNNFKPNVSYKSIQHLEAKRRREERDLKEYLDWLDQREQQLYDEIEFINSMKKYVRDNEPYF